MRLSLLSTALASLVAVAGTAPLAGQNGARTYAVPSATAARVTAVEAEAPLRVDGVLDEAAWVESFSASDFRQREPAEGEPATERTEVRVLVDERTLYIGVMAYDSDPSGIIARILQRDQLMQSGFGGGGPEFAGDDAIAILFDPFHTHRNGVVFATNPNGAIFDALLTDEGREFNVDWQTVWEVAAAVTDDGWSAEFAIPFRSLRYPTNAENAPWGFNVYRVIRRKNEEVLWSSWLRGEEGFQRVSRAGHLEGLDNLPRSNLNLEIKPFLLGGGTQQEAGPADTDIDGRYDLGVDLKYEVRPGLTFDGTVNTDFAQVEVDNQQVNLTRFSLFFPEKRDFFLENAGVFEFGTRGGFEPPPFLMFFSRRIGISSEGVIPILAGGRLTGRIGGQTVGVLNVVTDRQEFVTSTDSTPTISVIDRENFAVGRFKRDIGSNNYVGAMITDRRSSHRSNTVGGVDFSAWPTSKLNVQGYLAGTTSSDGPSGTSYRLGAQYQSDFFNADGQHIYVDPDVETAMGFVLRKDLRRSELNLRIVPRPNVLGLRRVSVFTRGNYQTRTDGILQDWRLSTGISPTWNTGDDFVLFLARGFTRLDEGFDLSDEVFIPAGDYDVWEIGGFANSSTNRPVFVSIRGGYEQFYEGRRLELSGDITLAANANLSLTGGLSHNHVDTPFGVLDADIGSLRVSVAASTKLFANALVQYNSLDNVLSANIRLNYIYRPGSDFFLVFTEERGSVSSLSSFRNRGLVAKLTYLSRF